MLKAINKKLDMNSNDDYFIITVQYSVYERKFVVIDRVLQEVNLQKISGDQAVGHHPFPFRTRS